MVPDRLGRRGRAGRGLPQGQSPARGAPDLAPRSGAPLTADEARRFLEPAKRDRDPRYAAYVLILVLGLRKGEVVGLPWSAVDLDHAELDISWQLQRVRGQLLHRATKTEASDAKLPLPGICVTALRMRQKDQYAARVADQWPETGLVFTTLAGTAYEPRNFNRRFETRCARAGSVVSPSTTPGIRAPPCSPRSTFIPGWPCGYSVTLRST